MAPAHVAQKMAGDVLDAHRAAGAVTLQGQPVDQTYRVSMERVDLQFLLDLGPALLGRQGALADGR